MLRGEVLLQRVQQRFVDRIAELLDTTMAVRLVMPPTARRRMIEEHDRGP